MVDRKRVPAHLHDRYGIRPRNKPLIAFIGLAALILCVYVFVTVGQRVNTSSETRLITWETQSEKSVVVTFSVYKPQDEQLLCVLRAQDEDRFDVGYALARVDYPSKRPTFTVTLNTREEAFTVTQPICDYADSPALIGSHFRPGQLPPAQAGGLFAPWQDVTTSLD
jgi:hypothetical protein